MNRLVFIAGSFAFLALHRCVDAATTTIKCSPDYETSSMCAGHQLDITCLINGTIETGIAWARPANEANGMRSLDIFTCSKPGAGETTSKCFDNSIPGYELVENSLSRQVLRVHSFTEEDLGKWSCRDGDKALVQECDISDLLVAPKLEELKATCEDRGDGHFNTSCTRVKDSGSPPVSLYLSINDEKQDVNITENKFWVLKNDIDGYKVTCSLDGPAASCLKKTIDSMTCPESQVGVIIGSVLGGTVLCVVVAFVGVWWFRKSKRGKEDIIGDDEKSQVKEKDEQKGLMDERAPKETNNVC